MSDVRFFGIRHHGPGSARALLNEFEAFRPTCVLIEGLPEALPLLKWLGHDDLVPPVALVAYAVDDPANALFSPFCEFSPEFVAIRWAQHQQVSVEFIDMPAAHTLSPTPTAAPQLELNDSTTSEPAVDPLGLLAQAAGFDDGERFWEWLVEERRETGGVFEAVSSLMDQLALMGATRTDQRTLQREAFMRQAIRQAVKRSELRVAVVVGALHVPALKPFAKTPGSTDQKLLKSLPKIKVEVAWGPWSYDRVAVSSGYGAGVISPAFYEHLWRTPEAEIASQWVMKAARLLRSHELDASPASAIEAVRLAEALSALRDKPRPGLAELQESVLSVLAQGQTTPMQLIEQDLVIGRKLGRIPEDMPTVPILRDFAAQNKSFRLKLDVEMSELKLDLRKDFDRRRSQYLHQLCVIGCRWGETQEIQGAQGSFREEWVLAWRPEIQVELIEAGKYGTTIRKAALSTLLKRVSDHAALATVTEVLGQLLLTGLGEGLPTVLASFRAAATETRDVVQLLRALPPLAQTVRYGSVREFDTQEILQVYDSLLTRMMVGLPSACQGLSEIPAEEIGNLIFAVTSGISLVDNAEQKKRWQATLSKILDLDDVHGLLQGRLVRLLRQLGVLDDVGVIIQLQRILSPGTPHLQAAFWIEGFLGDSALALIHDPALLEMIDDWVISLPFPAFKEALPLLRRTFATFSKPERARIHEALFDDGTRRSARQPEIRPELVAKVQPVLDLLLGGPRHG